MINDVNYLTGALWPVSSKAMRVRVRQSYVMYDTCNVLKCFVSSKFTSCNDTCNVLKCFVSRKFTSCNDICNVRKFL